MLPCPVGGLAFVAVKDADVVERFVTGGAQKRGPVGGDRTVEPQPVHHERRRGAQPPYSCPPHVVAEVR